MNKIGRYKVKTFPNYRIPTIDTLKLGKNKNHIPILFEVDITIARELLVKHREETNERISFTGWIIKCIAQAISENKNIHAMRKGKKIILFDDVDISIVVERIKTENETLPMPYVIRKTNEKDLHQINDEINIAKNSPINKNDVQLEINKKTATFTKLPYFLRNLIVWRRLNKNPFYAKEKMGTVVVSSLHNISSNLGYNWFIPIGIHPIVVSLGSISQKPLVIENEIKIRDVLCMTILFDHDVIDGAPVTKFVNRLKELLNTGFAIKESFGQAECPA